MATSSIYDTVKIKDSKVADSFSYSKNPEIELFLKKNAIPFALKKMSVTYNEHVSVSPAMYIDFLQGISNCTG